MKPLSPAEHDRLIEEFIQHRGVTKCPTGWALGAESSMTSPVAQGYEPLLEGGCYWRHTGEDTKKYGGEEPEFATISHTPDLVDASGETRSRNGRRLGRVRKPISY